jgi:hypothetical protein
MYVDAGWSSDDEAPVAKVVRVAKRPQPAKLRAALAAPTPEPVASHSSDFGSGVVHYAQSAATAGDTGLEELSAPKDSESARVAVELLDTSLEEVGLDVEAVDDSPDDAPLWSLS